MSSTLVEMVVSQASASSIPTNAFWYLLTNLPSHWLPGGKGQDPPLFVVSPGQIGFTPDGQSLVVLVKGVAEGYIWTFPISSSGIAVTGSRSQSHGFTPFSFDFDASGHLLVAEAFGTATAAPAVSGPQGGTGAVSSYIILPNGQLELVNGSVGNDQTATCWLKQVGSCVFTSNNVANTLSSYSVDSSTGVFTLNKGVAAQLDAPIDISIDGDFLYVISTGNTLASTDPNKGQPSIEVFTVNQGDCSLTLTNTFTDGLPNEGTTVFGVAGLVSN